MPNNEEIATSVTQTDTDATKVYDDKHGRYEDKQGQNLNPAAKPNDLSTPFSVGGAPSDNAG